MGDIAGDFGKDEFQQAAPTPQAGPQPDLALVLMAIGTSLLMSMTTEFIGWLIVYRHDEYKKAV